MSQNLDQILIEQFLSDAHAEFQSSGFLLEDSVRTQSGVKGSVLHFPVFGEGMANQKAPQDDVVPLNISNRDVTLTLEDWYAPEYADRSFQNKIAVNAVEEYTKLCSMALARRSDQLIIDVIEALTYAASPTSTQGASVVAGGTGLTFAKMRGGNKFLRQRAPSGAKKYFIMDAEGEEDLLNESQLTSSDFVNKKAIDGEGLNGMELMGYKFIVLPDMAEGGLASGTAYMYNDLSVGYGAGERLGGDISWENVKTSYLINMWLEANAVVIDPRGLVQVNFVV